MVGELLCWERGGPTSSHHTSVATLDVGGDIGIHVGSVVALGGSFLHFLEAVVAGQDVSIDFF